MPASTSQTPENAAHDVDFVKLNSTLWHHVRVVSPGIHICYWSVLQSAARPLARLNLTQLHRSICQSIPRCQIGRIINRQPINKTRFDRLPAEQRTGEIWANQSRSSKCFFVHCTDRDMSKPLFKGIIIIMIKAHNWSAGYTHTHPYSR